MAAATKEKPVADGDKKVARVQQADYKLLVSSGRDDEGRETYVELAVIEKAKNPLDAIALGIDQGIGIEDGDVIAVCSVKSFKTINVEIKQRTSVRHRAE
jgi:hypothetical protein